MRQLLISSIIVCCVVIAGCENSTDVSFECGPEKWYNVVFTIEDGGKINGERTIILDANTEPNDICSKAGVVTPDFYFYADNPMDVKPADMELVASARLPARSERKIPMVNDGEGLYRSIIEMNLDGLNGNPGFMVLQIVVTFPTRGDWQTDSIYLKNHMQMSGVIMKYREYIHRL